MYLNVGVIVPNAIYDRAASQWYVLVCLGFVPCFTSTTMWIAERKVLRRETSDDTYPVWLFYVGKIVSVVPYEIFFGQWPDSVKRAAQQLIHGCQPHPP